MNREELRKEFKESRKKKQFYYYEDFLEAKLLYVHTEGEKELKCKTWCADCKAFDWSSCKNKYKDQPTQQERNREVLIEEFMERLQHTLDNWHSAISIAIWLKSKEQAQLIADKLNKL